MNYINNTVCWEIAVTNNGPDDNTNVVVTESLPTELTFVSATISGTATAVPYDTGTGVLTVGNVADGATVNITFCAEITGGAGTTVTNSASVSGDNADTVTTDNSDDDELVIEAVVTGNDACNCVGSLETQGMSEGSLAVNGALWGGQPPAVSGIAVSSYTFPITVTYTINGGNVITQTYTMPGPFTDPNIGVGDLVEYVVTNSTGTLYTGVYTESASGSGGYLKGQGITPTNLINNCATGGGIDLEVRFYTNVDSSVGDNGETVEVSYDGGTTYIPYTPSGGGGTGFDVHTFTSITLPFVGAIYTRVLDSSGNLLQEQGQYANIADC